MKTSSLLLVAAGLLSVHQAGNAQTTLTLCDFNTLSLVAENLDEGLDSVLWTWNSGAVPSEWEAELTDSTLTITSASAANSGIYELVQYTTAISDTDTVVVSSIAATWDVSVYAPFQLIVPDATLSICPEVDSTTFYPILTTGGSGGVEWNWFIQTSDSTYSWDNPNSPELLSTQLPIQQAISQLPWTHKGAEPLIVPRSPWKSLKASKQAHYQPRAQEMTPDFASEVMSP